MQNQQWLRYFKTFKKIALRRSSEISGASQQLNAGLFQNPLIGAQPFAQMGMINAAAFSQQAAANMGMNLGMLQAPQQAIRMQAQQQVVCICFFEWNADEERRTGFRLREGME